MTELTLQAMLICRQPMALEQQSLLQENSSATSQGLLIDSNCSYDLEILLAAYPLHFVGLERLELLTEVLVLLWERSRVEHDDR